MRMKDARPRRTRLLSVRMTPAEYDTLQSKADAVGIEISNLVRSMILDSDRREPHRRKTPDTVALGKAIASLNKVGGLFNMIAKQANLVGDLTSFQEAQADRARLAEAVGAIMAALGELGR